jgi:hypothetical protein
MFYIICGCLFGADVFLELGNGRIFIIFVLVFIYIFFLINFFVVFFLIFIYNSDVI